MKKRLRLPLVLTRCPLLACAEDSAANMLSCDELAGWAKGYIERAYAAEPLNVPSESETPDGYAYIYEFATLYADTPVLGADTSVNAIVVTSEEEKGPRDVGVNSALSDVLAAYYTENAALTGSKESAVLYAADMLPDSAAWGQVLRDGQRIRTVQYAAHEQMATGGEGYSDAGVIYTMVENRVSAIRVYGLNSRITGEEVSAVLFTLMMEALENDYAQVPFSYDGAELAVFSPADMIFSGLDFLTVTPENAIAALGEPMDDQWVENGDDGYIRVLTFPACEMTWLFNEGRTEGRVYMLRTAADGLEGPRAVRVGDTFASVYNRFRNGEGEYQEDGTEALYAHEDGSFGSAVYGTDASATLRYGFTAPDGRQVVLQLHFTVMELTEILLYCE